MAEDEVVGWHHQLNGHKSEEAPGVGDGQGSLACCSPWGLKSQTVQGLNHSVVQRCRFLPPLPALVRGVSDDSHSYKWEVIA